MIGGEIVYTITGDSPEFHEIPDNYLIPDGYEKFLPEAAAFCQSNVKQLQSSQSGRGMLTALLESPNPFLKLMAVRELSEDPIAMRSSTAPTRMITDALSAHGELQAALVAILLSEGGVNADKLMTSIMTRINTSTQASDYAYLALGCSVPGPDPTSLVSIPDPHDVFVAMASKQLHTTPHIVRSQLVDSILLSLKLLPLETSQSKLR